MSKDNIGRQKSDVEKGLVVDGIAYLCAFGAGAVPFLLIGNPFAAAAAFTATATAVLYLFSVVFSDVSIYDPYWSAAPPVMLLAVVIRFGFWNVNAVLILALIVLWSFRLTANWLSTYRGLGHEDWRYAMYREKYPPLVFQMISFFGLHFVPTAVVYAGLVSGLLAIRETGFAPLSVVGILVMIGAVLLEFSADRAIHRFLREHGGEGRTCDVSVWRYSRHPNYLGEISFWIGLYLYFAALRPDIWYMGLGFLAVVLLFLTVSIPMMERHNEQRRTDYAAYKKRTSMLLLLPPKKERTEREAFL
ncbi:MAG: DUF1295 domain-containing protein [Clostridia bacterium]|nr:DUF1295 domain-containing protein [Clostridia bacterium]